ncbi:MAG TPA: DUF4288 domain-containing protein [Thermoanaerobaculia bacterium]|jgi:hypothetical protein
MSWYVAVVVRGSFVNDSLHEERLADKLFKLIEAPDAEAAYQKALGLIDASTWDEMLTDDDGTAAELRAMGLADLREIDAPQLADGVEVYAEATSEPSQKVVTEKGQLTVFEVAEIPEDGGVDEPVRLGEEETEAAEESEAAPDPRFSDGTPIR